jgi:hypothetical protein
LLTGVHPADSEISVRAGSSLWSTNIRTVMSGRCTRKKGEELDKRGKSGQSVLTGTFIGVRRYLCDLELDSKQPGGRERGRKGAGERGDWGDLYRHGGASN